MSTGPLRDFVRAAKPSPSFPAFYPVPTPRSASWTPATAVLNSNQGCQCVWHVAHVGILPLLFSGCFSCSGGNTSTLANHTCSLCCCRLMCSALTMAVWAATRQQKSMMNDLRMVLSRGWFQIRPQMGSALKPRVYPAGFCSNFRFHFISTLQFSDPLFATWALYRPLTRNGPAMTRSRISPRRRRLAMMRTSHRKSGARLSDGLTCDL